jgi:hypothetical protein
MGDQPARKVDPPARKERRPAAGQPPRRSVDPIFSKPYEPAAPQAEAPKATEPQQRGKRKQPQLAALLGGLKRA